MQTLLIPILIVAGWASQYAPGKIEQVINVRQTRSVRIKLPARLPKTDGFIAVLDCAEIGNVWHLRPEGTKVFESFLVVDCAGPGAAGWMRRNNILVEVDFKTAVRWSTVGHGQRVERAVEFAWARPWVDEVMYAK